MTEQEDLEKLRHVRIHRILAIDDTYERVSLSCPFHNDRTPSFMLYKDNSYYCFGCGVTGQNAIDFCLQLGYSFPEVIEELKKYV